mmetsp:Transcript_22386/g.44345  ORF Transcript_22386/g.44345 Transcript_22386/m.44345 type:complete len:112 (+) Transcript_22386:54-389(+)
MPDKPRDKLKKPLEGNDWGLTREANAFRETSGLIPITRSILLHPQIPSRSFLSEPVCRPLQFLTHRQAGRQRESAHTRKVSKYIHREIYFHRKKPAPLLCPPLHILIAKPD